MKLLIKLRLLVPILTSAYLLSVASASADIVFTLNNVGFIVHLSSGNFAAGTLSGTFTTSGNLLNASTTLSSWNITATSTGLINGHAFAGFNYTNSNSTAYYNVGSSGLLTGLELDSPIGSTTANNGDSLRLYFATNLSATGSTSISAYGSSAVSYESEHLSGGNRSVSSGTVIAATVAPEPSTIALCLMTLGALLPLALTKRLSLGNK